MRRAATSQAQPAARLLFDIPGEAGGLPQWWDGVGVLAWRASG